MGSRTCGLHIDSKRISGLVYVFAIILLLSFFETSAKTFLFKPTTQPSYYSDTANWVNRDYPGRQVVFGDTISFEINDGFQEVIIDSNIILEGNFQIGIGVHLNVPKDISITFRGVLDDPIGLWMDRVRLFADTASLVTINGKIFFYGVGARMNGSVNIVGNIWADADASPNNTYSQYLFFNKVSISGGCGGIGLIMSCKSLYVDTSANVFIYSGYTWNGGSLRSDTVINKGEISLMEETGMDCSYIHNEGQLKAGYLSGKLNNSGAIEIVQKPTNSFTANLFDVVNSGSVQLYGSVYAPIFLNGVNNTGIFQVADYLNETSTVPWLTVNGAVFNSNQWIQSGNVNTAEMFGEMTNTGAFGVSGKTNFNSGTFTNNGSCNFYNPAFDFGIRIRNQFINNANLSIYGPLEITGQLYNHGNMTIRP